MKSDTISEANTIRLTPIPVQKQLTPPHLLNFFLFLLIKSSTVDVGLVSLYSHVGFVCYRDLLIIPRSSSLWEFVVQLVVFVRSQLSDYIHLNSSPT